MSNWTYWQKVTFLGYLLLLNVIVLGALAYVVFSNDFWEQSKAETSANLPAATSRPEILPTVTSFPSSSTASLSPLKQNKKKGQKDNSVVAKSTSVPSIVAQLPSAVNDTLLITPAPTSTNLPQLTWTPAFVFKLTPKPIATPSPTATNTPRPTVTPTNTPSHTPRPSPTFTSTSTPTPMPTATATATTKPTQTPRPTATPTNTPSHTPRPSPTFTSTSTPTPMPTATATVISTLTPPPSFTPIFTGTHTLKPLAMSSQYFLRSLLPHIVQEATPIPVAAASLNAIEIRPIDASPARLVRPDQPQAGVVELADVIALSHDTISLNWTSVGKNTLYRVYSDMGSGYGVYIYKANTTAPTFIDGGLRAGMNYRYRIMHDAAGQEIIVAKVVGTTLGKEKINSDALAGKVVVVDITPAPTALPSDTVLLGLLSDNKFTDNFNMLTIAGEVRNDSNLAVGQSEITITFYDSAGAVIDTTNGKTMIEVIPPGETSPFLVALPRPTGMASYSLRAVARPVTPRLTAQLSVTEVRRFEDKAGFFHVKGAIQNVGKKTAKRVKVAAIIYGRDGQVINVGFTYVDPPNLAPGQEAAYDVVFTYYPRYVTQAVIPFEE